jgi:phenylalanyl-tRNA synthetase beta subunit
MLLFKTLLASEVSLKDKNCVFSKDDEIISLSRCYGRSINRMLLETKKVLVECAYFNPESIIGKSIKYN